MSNINKGMYTTYMNPDNLQQDSFVNQIMRHFPNGSAPMFALSGSAGKAKAKSITHGYFSKTWEFPVGVINGAKTAADTTLTVVSTAGLVPKMVLHNPATRENMHVRSVDSATAITVTREFGRVAAAAIADGARLIAIGTAHEQGSKRPTPRSIKTQWQQTFTQIWRNAWALTDTARATLSKAGFSNIAENRKDNGMFHSQDIEYSMHFGQASIDPNGGENGQPLHTTQGVIDALMQYAPDHVTTAGATTSYSELEDMTLPAFQYSTNGSDNRERMAYTGEMGMKVINQIGRAQTDPQISLNENSFGMVFTTYRTSKGRVHVYEHPLYTAAGPGVSDSLLILDKSAVRMAYLDGRDTRPEEFGVGGTFNANDDTGATSGLMSSGVDAVGGSLTTEAAVEYVNPYSGVLINGLTEGVK